MHRILKITARVVVGVSLALIVFGALLVAAVQIPAVQQWLLDEALPRVNDNLDGEVRAERLSGSLLTDATLYDVEVDDARGNRVLRAEEIRADYSLIALLLGKNRLESATLRSPVVDVTRYPDDTLNIQQITPEAPEEETAWTVERVATSNASLTYRDETAPGGERDVLEAHHVASFLRLPRDGRGRAVGELSGADVVAGDYSFQDLDVDATIDGLDLAGDDFGAPLDFDIDAKSTAVASERLRAGGMGLETEGSVTPSGEGADEPIEHLDAAGTVSLSAVTGAGIDADRIDTDFDVDGPPSAPTGAVETNFGELTVDDYSLGTAALDVDLRRDAGFQLDARAVPEVMPELLLFLTAAGAYSDSFETWSLTSLELGRPELSWQMPEPSRIAISDGYITFDDLILERADIGVTLDGTYRLEGRSVTELVGRIGLAQLRELVDPRAIEKAIPDELRDELPEETDDVREDIEEGIREGMPDVDDLF